MAKKKRNRKKKKKTSTKEPHVRTSEILKGDLNDDGNNEDLPPFVPDVDNAEYILNEDSLKVIRLENFTPDKVDSPLTQ
jgi:hypothetical protein